MMFFVEGMNHSIYKDVKEGSFVPSLKIDGVVANKLEKDLTKDDKKKVQHNLKVKTIITTALGLIDFLRVSHCGTGKEMRNILQFTHEGTAKVNRKKFDTLTHK